MADSYLVLEDGTVYEGEAFGSHSEAFGEIVFSTGTSGYQESMTDPSFRGQILVFTFPLIGDYGVAPEFVQSDGVQVRAVVVQDYSEEPTPYYGGKTIDDYLKEQGVPGISGVDTRDLVIRIRTAGTMRAGITYDKDSVEDLVRRLGSTPMPSEDNLVGEVSVSEQISYDDGRGLRIGVLDCGIKAGLLGDLRTKFDVTVFPYDTPSDIILESGVRGLIVSNGPGNPSNKAIVDGPVRTVREVSGRMPIYGVGLGNQIIALAFGGSTYKMKFGHHGSNQPVEYDGRVYITSQSHGFAVDADSLEGSGLVADQFNVNDRTVEGMKSTELPLFSTQYCPEASLGPRDTEFLLDRFAEMIKEAEE